MNDRKKPGLWPTMERIEKDVMEAMLVVNQHAGWPVDPLTLALSHGWDFDVACPPNLIPARIALTVAGYYVLLDQDQFGFVYIFTQAWQVVWCEEFEVDSVYMLLAAAVDWIGHQIARS